MRETPPLAGPDDWRGDLSETPLPEILHRLWENRKTGCLTVVADGPAWHLFIEKGELRAASSDSDERRLGSHLRRRGLISEEDVREALAEVAASGGKSRFGKALIARGAIGAEALHAEAVRLVEEIVSSGFLLERGTFAFRSARGRIDPEIAVDLSTRQLVLDGLRRLPGDRGYERRLGDATRLARRAEIGPGDAPEPRLAPHEAFVLSLCDGRTTFAEILKMGENRAVTAKTLYALAAAGLIAWGEHSRQRPPAPREDSRQKNPAGPGIDVAREHRRLVEELWGQLPGLSDRELLGLSEEYSQRELEEAYGRKLRLFSPAPAESPELADLAPKMEAIVQRVTDAWNNLRRPDRPALDGAADAETRAAVAHANYLSARTRTEEGDAFGAVVLLQEAVRLESANPEYRYRLAQALSGNPMWGARAIEQFREAIRLDPLRVEVLRDYATLLADRGRLAEAEPLARQLCELDPFDPRHAHLLERVRRATGRAEG